ncbi:MAG: TIGR00725 family protein [Actinomycetota bacterium]
MIAVVGTGADDPYLETLAFDVGRLIAEAGCTVVCGGLGGVMLGACRGAKAAGGHTIGILPGPARTEANPYVDDAVATGMGEARNAVVVRTADAVIAVGGGYGTLSEIALALRAGRRVVGLETWEASVGGVPAGVVRVSTPEQAVRAALPARA